MKYSNAVLYGVSDEEYINTLARAVSSVEGSEGTIKALRLAIVIVQVDIDLLSASLVNISTQYKDTNDYKIELWLEDVIQEIIKKLTSRKRRISELRARLSPLLSK